MLLVCSLDEKDENDTKEKTVAILDVLLLKPVGGTTQPGEPAKPFCIMSKD